MMTMMTTRLEPARKSPGRARAAVTFWILSAILVAVALLTRSALAQEITDQGPFDLVGHVVDEDGRPQVGAFVSLTGSEWGSLTNEEGRFLIPDAFPGQLFLTVEQLGYETLEWSGDVRSGEAVRLTLTAKPILLEGLTVVTDRFAARRNATATGVRAYGRKDLATTPQESALDFLSARAGLTPYRCNAAFSSQCFVVRGRLTEPVVWIDEAPVIGGIDYLQVVEPHELYMVEVYGSGRHIRAYTNHFMEYAANARLRPIPLLY